jgi:Peptidase A4 family
MASIIKLMPLLLAGSVLAVPSRRSTIRSSRPASLTNVTIPGIAATDYTTDNWAGAIIENTDVTTVTGTFEVPAIDLPAGGDTATAYCGCAWVGIDGFTNDCDGGLMQAGIDWCIQDGDVSYSAWSEYWPAEAQVGWDIAISQGDLITVTIDTSSTTSGTATLENTSTGQTVTRTWSGMSPALCLATAEWIVEDYTVNGGEVAFADFNQVYWADTDATVDGASWGASPSNIIDLVEGSDVLATAYLDGNNVIINYGTGY